MRQHHHQPRYHRQTGLMVAGCLGAAIALGLTALLIGGPSVPPALAQRYQPIRTDGVWQQVYQQVPDLPLENQYVSTETGKVATDNTLVGRFIRYHIYVKGRPPYYRLDWKISLADYLGLNEFMNEPEYPSGNRLRQNPMESDIAAIRKLTRSQRLQLVQALTDAFASQLPEPAMQAKPAPTVAPFPAAKPIRVFGPGSADLLKP